MLAPAQRNTQLESPSLDEVIREEMQQALCPVISSRSVAVNRRNEPPRSHGTYATVVRQPRRHVKPLPVPRKTDMWRTDDNRSVCFHCGTPGHVITLSIWPKKSQPISHPPRRGKLSEATFLGGEAAGFSNPPAAARMSGNHLDVRVDGLPVKALMDADMYKK
ncbi:CCHC-type domain-containing protein [Trichonephila inaurata madagascariensis]|uniref:CCHC-type domain-containing protein n=1 Tax=Trichonephila inaurata madagascariensis TaxID=2747483 RepID=A0A8X6JLL4_9ARAC|nr:CCHC-type domain-containing protein [Trichonephila inaurata madagascariensis]